MCLIGFRNVFKMNYYIGFVCVLYNILFAGCVLFIGIPQALIKKRAEINISPEK